MALEAAPQGRTHQLAKEQGKTFVGVSPDIPKNKRVVFGDLVMAQSKVRFRWIALETDLISQTMSFLAYVLRVKSTALAEYLNVLPEIAVRLMKDCPSEACTMRKVRSTTSQMSDADCGGRTCSWRPVTSYRASYARLSSVRSIRCSTTMCSSETESLPTRRSGACDAANGPC